MKSKLNKGIGIILSLVITLSFIAIFPNEVCAASYRENIINAVLTDESKWYDKEIVGTANQNNAFIEFADLNFDGKLEFIFGYNMGTGRNNGRIVYYYSDGKLIKARDGDVNKWGGPSYYEDYSIYYDKNTGKLKNLGSSYENVSVSDWTKGNYEMTFNGKNVKVQYYSACKHSGYDYEKGFTYFNGANSRGDIGKASKITEKSYNAINKSKTKNCIKLKLDTVKINLKNWKYYARSAKLQKLMQSYNGYSLSSPNLAAPKLSSAVVVKNKGITVSWKAATGVKRYYIYRKTNNGKWIRIGSTTAKKYTDKAVKKGNKYTYTVRGVAANGNLLLTSYNKKGITKNY